MKIVGQGRRGTITLTMKGNQKIATKTANSKETVAALQKEATILRTLHHHQIPFVPQLIETKKDGFTYYRLPGQPLRSARKTIDPKTRYTLAMQLFEKAYELDKIGVIHGELSKPTTNVLVSPEGEVYILDFDRGTLGDFSGKNMRHVAQRLAQQGMLTIGQIRQLKSKNKEEIYTFVCEQVSRQPASWTLTHEDAIFLGATGVLVILDQVTKYVFYDIALGSEFFLLTPAFNTGIGRSLPVGRRLVIPLSILLIGALIYRRKKHKMYTIVFILLIAGAVGNLIDRLSFHGVRDFIDFQYRPIFNFADIYISCGLALLLAYELKLIKLAF